MAKSEPIEIEGHDGTPLSALIDRPIAEPKAWALFAHCFSCSKDIQAARHIAQRLVEQGLGVLRFDFSGLGGSGGNFGDTNFTTNIQDLLAAAAWLKAAHGGPQLLIGHSLGGAAVVAAGSQIDTVKAVATIGAPADADHVTHLFQQHLSEISSQGEADVKLAGRPFTIKQQFVDDVRGADVRAAATALGRPLLVMHAPLDDLVGIENATGLFVAAKHPKSFVSLDKADHLLTRKVDAQRAADMIATWAEPYVFDAGTAQPAQDARGSRDVVVSETGRGSRFENLVEIGEHLSIADEPIEVGGGGKGPDPYEYVSAGLGACTSMTLRMYADRKKWPLESVSVEISHSKDYADDCENCEKDRKIDVFTRVLTVTGDLDADQKARLLEIADKCPVHRTLESSSLVRTQLG
jgi:putative redox protein